MIDLYFFPSPNTWKVAIMLEECGLPYQVRLVDITKDEQLTDEFQAISPNGRVPAIVDLDADGGPQAVFESGAILVYLAEKTGMFLPRSGPGRIAAMEWLFWQMGGLGPMAGQAHHFIRYKAEGNEYAVKRYQAEVARLYGVLDRRLRGREWIAEAYGIADMASWGWVWFHRMHGQSLDDFPDVSRWFFAMASRPAVQRARALAVNRLPDSVQAIFDGPFYQGDADKGAQVSYVQSAHETSASSEAQ
ncbi:glutathione S-transferase [Croceicoccus ponticola]|uniref:Glutathione S-transferase n=1 Tax=Croceicoccus ponticola TaxID=2217664 RepID=A0A437GTY5_9SPHN|nr:glutathione S-transferase [Croceicoccus ponticola]